MTVLTAPVSVLRYEVRRLGTTRSTRSVALLTLLCAVAFTLTAARQMADLSQFSHGAVWIIGGGVTGGYLPAPAASCAAAWLGSSSVSHEYRPGVGARTFCLVPRRSALLLGKAAAAALSGAALLLLATVVAYAVTLIGFSLSTSASPVALATAVPTTLETAVAAACGAAGVLAGLVFRWRLIAVPLALGGVAATTAALPQSVSPASRAIVRGLKPVTEAFPGLVPWNVCAAAWALLAVLAVIAVRRRRAR